MAIQVKANSPPFLFQIMLLYQEEHRIDVNVEKCVGDRQTSHVILSSANSEAKLKAVRVCLRAEVGLMSLRHI